MRVKQRYGNNFVFTEGVLRSGFLFTVPQVVLPAWSGFSPRQSGLQLDRDNVLAHLIGTNTPASIWVPKTKMDEVPGFSVAAVHVTPT